jgi:uncharacterized membrane protein HdeD (DUF308 family)
MFDKMKELNNVLQIYLKLSAIHNWKSTLMGVLSAVAAYLVTVDWTNPAALKTAILPITLIIKGVVTKDADVSDTGTPANPYTKQ